MVSLFDISVISIIKLSENFQILCFLKRNIEEEFLIASLFYHKTSIFCMNNFSIIKLVANI